MHDPHVLASFTVGDKRDPFSVWRKFWLAVKRHAAGDQLGLPTLDGQGVDVAKQFKRDALPIRRRIQGNPRAFIGGELNFPVGLQGQALLLFFFLVLLVLLVLFFFFLLFLE